MAGTEQDGRPRFARARPGDAEPLAQVSKRAFDEDVHYGAPGLGGPPGYDSAAWQAKMMRLGEYFKIIVGEQTVGGMIVFRKRVREHELGRIFIDPDYQNRGFGTLAFQFLWREYPLAKRWTLGTPAWNLRTRHFYHKVGFSELGEDGHGGILFERQTACRTQT
jgi:RimJ/RimL family protein N-acetyltransferase